MKQRFPVRILQGQSEMRPFRATTALAALDMQDTAVETALAVVELDYAALMAAVGRLIRPPGRAAKVDPRVYWMAGDLIVAFFNRLDELNFYLDWQNKTIARDLHVSESFIKRVTSFRRRVPRLSMVDVSVSWTSQQARGFQRSEQQRSVKTEGRSSQGRLTGR